MERLTAIAVLFLLEASEVYARFRKEYMQRKGTISALTDEELHKLIDAVFDIVEAMHLEFGDHRLEATLIHLGKRTPDAETFRRFDEIKKPVSLRTSSSRYLSKIDLEHVEWWRLISTAAFLMWTAKHARRREQLTDDELGALKLPQASITASTEIAATDTNNPLPDDDKQAAG